MYGYPKGQCSWLFQLNTEWCYSPWYGGNTDTYSKLNLQTRKHTKAGCQPWRPLGRFVTREDWDPVDIRGRFICCGNCFGEVSWFLLVFLRLSFSLRQFKLLKISKKIHVKTCKVSWAMNTRETAMGCWKERHFTYKCKRFGATIRMTLESILQTVSEIAEDEHEGSASWCFKDAGNLRYTLKCFTGTAV